MDTKKETSGDQVAAPMDTKRFHEIFGAEVAAISERRGKRGKIELEQENVQRDGTPIWRPKAGSNVVGLALSGGGIRSAAFCLGAMQALAAEDPIEKDPSKRDPSQKDLIEKDLFKKVDYLSTVSGGGYIGTSMTAAMTNGTNGDFPFASELREGEEPGVQHIRDHSNYLFPRGIVNVFTNLVVYLRGIVANVLLILPWLLIAAAITIWSNPNVDSLRKTDFFGYQLDKLPVRVEQFGLTLNALLLFLILLAVWGLWRSSSMGRKFTDVGRGSQLFGGGIIFILIIAFFEIQPLLLRGMFKLAQSSGDATLGSGVMSWLKSLAAVLAPVAAVIGFLGRYVGDLIKKSQEKPGARAFMSRLVAKLAIYIAAAAVPVVLWVAYLYLSFWGIEWCPEPPASGKCVLLAPTWLTSLTLWRPLTGENLRNFYFVVGIVLLVIGWRLSPNANSLHRLYRDRLSKAFLFDPTQRQLAPGKFVSQQDASLEVRRTTDLKPLDELKLSGLVPKLAPYHLINAALNIGGSKYANRRGRNADFFVFSPLFVGSEATGFVGTTMIEERDKGLNAGTALAISGAAASSNMGSATIRPLVPTLAMLNVRLGYWLINPKAVVGKLKMSILASLVDRLYFFNELFGRLKENGRMVYLTDGGHVENLGIYELLRRRCSLIIAIDAEADPEMSFGSLITLERYARIDFGIRIDLPWAAIRNSTHAASAEIAKSGGLPAMQAPHGPHCALGTIYYPRGQSDQGDEGPTGVLLYVKSSLSGDENDYITDYKRRYPDFPHETTADQLFSEEQFEAYRALGFHALYEAFKGRDDVSMPTSPAKWQGPQAATHPLEIRLQKILG